MLVQPSRRTLLETIRQRNPICCQPQGRLLHFAAKYLNSNGSWHDAGLQELRGRLEHKISTVKWKFPFDKVTGEAAVLVPLYNDTDGKARILFTKRVSSLRQHGGEISFPGGKMDSEDESYVHTALRETSEEVFLSPSKFQILGSLPALPNKTGTIRVHPIVAFYTDPLDVTESYPCNKEEVERVLGLEAEWLGDQKNMGTELFRGKVKSPVWNLPEGDKIWGLTAYTMNILTKWMA
ncbi:hypothetical protein SAICODRAFT_28649 [Saitoella complicata NRRL Y-17804]|uniref:Nudix hydrolase domain-containing protein n=1 Tax=Saitoella complicata (strain BCRC 22490 / CBS 7301 / JCM 7358 / NBRC 10748 / NRRL Y-17804) TaxID=698492 RepID=A0A0E9N9F7_SAICN|nr:uncharacterized protein SAICODRAFT_28649 [Saitoella complicata NRRL Y-17804]ODQ56576.1 hypothetical protein SAICODRAFT_28649 [Saitoella complicata NRRL Y-17804]GAO46449.1 hypothetical protein G7K_0680-t1 [Saitoella complicata NRRL Y-17804]